MRAWLPHVALALLASFLPDALSQATRSWTITSPNANTVWLDGTTNAVEWTVGREDVNIFDIELARLGAEGLKFVARNVSVALSSLNVNIQSLPPANDYFVIFTNRTGGVIYSISNKFTITDSRDAANGQAVLNKPTASIVGAPNPTETWALEFDKNGRALGAAAASPVLARQWWIGALGLLGAGAVSLL